MVKKILSVILIILGSILLAVIFLSFLTGKGPESTDTAYLIGYYLFFVFILLFGAGLIISGIQKRRKLKRKKIEEELIDSLPGEKII